MGGKVTKKMEGIEYAVHINPIQAIKPDNPIYDAYSPWVRDPLTCYECVDEAWLDTYKDVLRVDYIIIDPAAPLVRSLPFQRTPEMFSPIACEPRDSPLRTAFWVISTAHMPNPVPDFGNLHVRFRQEGFRIIQPVWSFQRSDLKDWLKPIYDHAPLDKKCFVVFDRDGVRHPALPTYPH